MGHLVPSPWASEPATGQNVGGAQQLQKRRFFTAASLPCFAPHHHKHTIYVPTTTVANKRLPVSLLIGVGNRTSPTTRSKAFIIEEQGCAKLLRQKDSNNPH